MTIVLATLATAVLAVTAALLLSLLVVFSIALRLHRRREDAGRAHRVTVEYRPRAGTLERRSSAR